MPKHYVMHAMGVKKALQFRKRHLEHYMSQAMGTPLRHVIVSGNGAARRLSDEEMPHEAGGKLMKKKLTPLSFKF